MNRSRRLTPGERFRQVLFFLRYTGSRPGEMAALTWDDVDLDAAVIVLRHHKTIRTQRTPRPRVIHLVPLVVKLLKRIKARQKPGVNRVFVTSRQTPWPVDDGCLHAHRITRSDNGHRIAAGPAVARSRPGPRGR